MKFNDSSIEKWGVFEIELTSMKHFERPFEDVELECEFECCGKARKVCGFHDGDSTWRIRFMPEHTGVHVFHTKCNHEEFDGLDGSFECVAPRPGNHGPVKLFNQHHFRYSDGKPCFIMGTTVYAWTYRPESIRNRTLASLKEYGFNKARMLFFPKYLHGFTEIDLTYEPPVLPFRGTKNDFDYRDFVVEYFRNFEDRVKDLMAIGVEADVILFHNYDFGMWGIDAGLNDDDAEFYLEYLISRLAAFRNVWWSLANEYDLHFDSEDSHARSKLDRRDWDRLGDFLMHNDPYQHMRSIHNWGPIYPNRDWMTHVSYQFPNVYSLLLELKHRYDKPVINDEYQYEGNLTYGWGNLTPSEETLRHWLTVMAGGYATHGECYVVDGNKKDIFWTYGGDMVGKSASRLKFLKSIVETLPFDEMEPDHTQGDGRYKFCLRQDENVFLYLLTEQCIDRSVRLIASRGLARNRYAVDVYDLWECTKVKETISDSIFNANEIQGNIIIRAEKMENS